MCSSEAVRCKAALGVVHMHIDSANSSRPKKGHQSCSLNRTDTISHVSVAITLHRNASPQTL